MKQPLTLAALAISFLSSCVSEKEKSSTPPEVKIERLVPDKVMAGQAFQKQPNGSSALSVVGSNLVKGSQIKMNGMRLETASGDGTALAAIVPPELFAKPGSFIVTVDTPDGRTTNSLAWRVLPTSGPAPVIRTMHPDTTAAGKGFNVQPNGVSAMGMTGENFLPGAKMSIDGKELETTFGDVDKLAGVLPPSAFAKPGKYKVVVKNPDGKLSEAKEFTVTN